MARPAIRQSRIIKRQRLGTYSVISEQTTTAGTQRCLMMRCIESGSRMLAEIVEASAQDQDDDVSHSELVEDQSRRRRSA
jgi:hypothetical protein